MQSLKKCLTYQTLIYRGGRSITTSATSREIFKIQTQEEFESKVKNSKTPVIVDFFAT